MTSQVGRHRRVHIIVSVAGANAGFVCALHRGVLPCYRHTPRYYAARVNAISEVWHHSVGNLAPDKACVALDFVDSSTC